MSDPDKFLGCWTNKDAQRKRSQMKDPGELDTIDLSYKVLEKLHYSIKKLYCNKPYKM